MKQYSQMKESGIESIGKIPEGWESRKLRTVCNMFGRIGYRGYTINDIVEEGEGAITLSPSNIIDDKFDLNKKIYLSWMKYEESPEIQIFDNDILLVKTGSTVGKVCMITNATEKMTINPQLVVLKSLKINSNFLLFFMVSNVFKDQLYASIAGGSTPTTSQGEILSHHILFPSPKEQKQIVSYLDKKTAKIDDEITKNQNLIKLLQEKRQSEINHAVTKGLDDSVEMKDSGIEWIGKIPEEWVNTKLKFILSLLKDGSHNPPPRVDDGIKFLSGATDIKNSKILFDKCSFISKDDYVELHKRYQLKDKDILLTIVATLGNVAIVEQKDLPFSMQRSIAVLRSKSIISHKFLFYFLHSKYFQENLISKNHGSVKPGIYLGELNNISLVYPQNISEQKQIVSYLDEKTTKIDSLISKIQLQISNLQDFRESLISSAVTGKIMVTQA